MMITSYRGTLLTLCFAIVGCQDGGEADDKSFYSVSVISSDYKGGAVTGGGEYAAGDTVRLVASPNNGYNFVSWKENGTTVSSTDNHQFSIKSNREFIGYFERDCDLSEGVEDTLDYTWSLEDEEITLANRNSCDTLYIWATSTPLCDGCINDINPVYSSISPGETIIVPAGIPKFLSWKPEVIYSNDRGDSFVFHPTQSGTIQDYHFPILVIDYSDYHVEQLDDFESMFEIDSDETIRGNCQNFSWLNRAQGNYQVAPDVLEYDSYCFVGNITGYTDSGDSVWLPALRYYVTDTRQ